MSETAREQLLALWHERSRDLERQVDLLYCPPGSLFTARYGLPPRVGCKGTTRDDRPCAAHAAIIGASGYCHWHDPALGEVRAAWAEGRKGSRLLRWFARIAPEACHAIMARVDIHPVCSAPLPALDLAGIPEGQRRVIVALLAEPTGRSYPATAAALGLHLGTVHRHLARVREHHPHTYAAVMAHRAAQLVTGQERMAATARGRRAQRRAAHRARYGREPWAR